MGVKVLRPWATKGRGLRLVEVCQGRLRGCHRHWGRLECRWRWCKHSRRCGGREGGEQSWRQIHRRGGHWRTQTKRGHFARDVKLSSVLPCSTPGSAPAICTCSRRFPLPPPDQYIHRTSMWSAFAIRCSPSVHVVRSVSDVAHGSHGAACRKRLQRKENSRRPLIKFLDEETYSNSARSVAGLLESHRRQQRRAVDVPGPWRDAGSCESRPKRHSNCPQQGVYGHSVLDQCTL